MSTLAKILTPSLTARTIAMERFADHNANEPTFDREKVTLIPEVKTAWDVFGRVVLAWIWLKQANCPATGGYTHR